MTQPPPPAPDADVARLAALLSRSIDAHRAGRLDEARRGYETVLAYRPDSLDALNNLALVCKQAGEHRTALALFDRALATDAPGPSIHVNRGNLLAAMGRAPDAIAAYDRAIALYPDAAGPHYARGCALRNVERLDDALASLGRAIELQPAHADAWYERGLALQACRRLEEAVVCFAQALRIAPDHPFAKGSLLHAKMLCCDWDGLDELDRSLRADVAAGRPAARPFGYQGICDDEASLRRCAELFSARRFPSRPVRWPQAAPRADGRIRVGYLCGELREQATSILMTGVWEAHTREGFEWIAFDAGWADGSAHRTRIERAFDRIVPIAALSDLDAARAIREAGIDVLVDLNGFFGRARQGVLALRPAPVQVSYLGFPGTLGVDYLDYLIADRIVIPDASRVHYTERVVRLPDSYQANDARRPIAAVPAAREAFGLPRQGFVFCCFNNPYKIVPATFDGWMRILRAVPGSVLWLREGGPAATRNLRLEAERRGVDGTRLVFAPIVPNAEHLARHRAADLVIDTLPYNAHTTASDALWAGVPVVTLLGTTFPGRVAASLLHAIGMPDLVARTPEQFEALAIALATEPRRLAEVRARLERQRASAPLYDTDRLARHLEIAYRTMAARQRAGHAPVAFDVRPIDVAPVSSQTAATAPQA
ncbi:MAG: tetratricopeptide repeat protein [Burkholderiales bacterium]